MIKTKVLNYVAVRTTKVFNMKKKILPTYERPTVNQYYYYFYSESKRVNKRDNPKNNLEIASPQPPDIQLYLPEHNDPSDIESKNVTNDKIGSGNRRIRSVRSNQLADHNEEAQIEDKTNGNAEQAKNYQHLADRFTEASNYKDAIKYYEKAHKLCPDLEVNESEMVAYQRVGDNRNQGN